MSEGGDHDDRGLRVLGAQVTQDLDAVDVRQAQVHQGQVGVDLVGQLQPFLAGAGHVDFDVVLAQYPGHERADVPFVVDDQDRVHTRL